MNSLERSVSYQRVTTSFIIIVFIWIILSNIFIARYGNISNIILTSILFDSVLLAITAIYFYKTIIKIPIDITALRKYQNLLDTIDGIVWEASADFRFTFVSKQTEKLLGFTSYEWFRTPTFWQDHIHPDDKERVIEFCKDQTSKKLSHDFEYRMIANDGRIVWLRDIVSVVIEDNTLTGLRGLMTDITEQVNTKIALEQSLSIISATLESTADGILVVDPQGRIVRFNKKFRTLWNVPNEVLDTKNDSIALKFILNQLKHPDLFIQKVEKLYATPYAESTDLIEFINGKIYERYSMPQLIDGKNVGRVWSFRDVTEQKNAILERENLLIKEKEARLAIEQSIKQRDDFLLIASHELRIPLTPIRLSLQMLKRHIREFSISNKKTELILKGLENADHQFDRFMLLIENLLDVSRITAGRLMLETEEFDLIEMIKKTLSDFEPELFKDGYALELLSVPRLIGIWDPHRLSQVILNLLNNAIKYGEGRPILVSVGDENGMAKIEVRDKGIGITKEDKTKIFGRYERTASLKHYEGLGLSLYISQNIISTHGGSISVESEIGKGARFTVLLPINTANQKIILQDKDMIHYQ